MPQVNCKLGKLTTVKWVTVFRFSSVSTLSVKEKHAEQKTQKATQAIKDVVSFLRGHPDFHNVSISALLSSTEAMQLLGCKVTGYIDTKVDKHWSQFTWG